MPGIPFRLKLTGDTADDHEFQGYDGYTALAGFAWTLSLITNFVETGQVRHRGHFPGRDAVRAVAPAPGSVLIDFTVWLTQHPKILDIVEVNAGGIVLNMVSSLLYDVTKRTIGRNIGQAEEPENDLMRRLERRRGGDLEALVAATEPAARQSHAVIGNGAQVITILGNNNVIGNLTPQTKEYVSLNVEDRTELEKELSVAAFNANSGYGSVYDEDFGHTLAISMNRDVLVRVRRVFTWGLDQYANRTGAKIRVRYWRILAMDGTPKKYVVLDAQLP